MKSRQIGRTRISGTEWNQNSYLLLNLTRECGNPRAWGIGAVQDLLAILVVEDDPLIQSVVEETLMEGGFEVAIVSLGQRAVELLDGTEAKYRALVTDVNLGRNKMERMGGSKA